MQLVEHRDLGFWKSPFIIDLTDGILLTFLNKLENCVSSSGFASLIINLL